MAAEADLLAALDDLIKAGGGVRRIARAHGVPAETLRRRWNAHREGAPPALEAAPPRARAPAREASALVDLSPVQRLEAELTEVCARMEDAARDGKAAVWAELNRQRHATGKALDAARVADKAAQEARDLAELVDPATLAAEMLIDLPDLLVHAPEAGREVYRVLRERYGETP